MPRAAALAALGLCVLAVEARAPRLRGASTALSEAVPQEQRDEVVTEAAETLRFVCADGSGGEMISYVRLRALATKI